MPHRLFLHISPKSEDDPLGKFPIHVFAMVAVLLPSSKESGSVVLNLHRGEEYLGYVSVHWDDGVVEYHDPVFDGPYLLAHAKIDDVVFDDHIELGDEEIRDLILDSMRRCGWLMLEFEQDFDPRMALISNLAVFKI